MNYFESVPKLIFEKPMSLCARKQLILFNKEFLEGANSIVLKEFGAKIDFHFEHIKEKGKFQVLSLYFMLFEKDDLIKIDDLVVLLYFSYLFHQFGSHEVKLNLSLAAQKTGISKTKIKDSIQNLLKHPLELLKHGGKSKHFIVT